MGLASGLGSTMSTNGQHYVKEQLTYKKMMLTIVFFILAICLTMPFSRALQVGFYEKTCPNAEAIVQQMVEQRYMVNNTAPAALIRMHFHDCYVRGCDASLLIDPINGYEETEKTAEPNLTIREFELIDEIKLNLEESCPQTVSCADIIALAARDAVALSGGGRYNVPTGRRDGLISKASEANLPKPNMTVIEARKAYALKGLTLDDMVVLLGSHSLGSSHCSFFRDRLYNFQGSGKPDKTMSGVLLQKLRRVCGPNSMVDSSVCLDQNTPLVLDSQYYNQLRVSKGILQLDQEIAIDPLTATLVENMASNDAHFKEKFAKAMVKMGNIHVLEGTAGEIRINCRVFNHGLVIG